MESRLPVTPELVKALARQAAEKQAAADLAEPDEEPATDLGQPPQSRSWLRKLGQLFGK